MLRGAAIWVSFSHFDGMLFNTVSTHVLQMTIIEIVNMIAMPNGGMATTWAMDMRLIAGWH